MFKANIKTSNAAFHDYVMGNGKFDDYVRNDEVARILREIANKLENGYTSGVCLDMNGNTVGDWHINNR